MTTDTYSADVMNDLMTIYMAGEASAETRRLVESYALEHPDFAARMRAAGGFALPAPVAQQSDAELRALKETRDFIRLRGVFLAAAILFTAFPFSFGSGPQGVHFFFLDKQPPVVWTCVIVAAAFWLGWFALNRKIRARGL